MSVDLTPPPPAPRLEDNESLRQASLPRLAGWGAVGAGVVLFAVLRLGLGLGSVAAIVLAWLVIMVALPTWSRVVEGSRKATDRLVTAFVASAFALAMVPLVQIMYTVVKNGAPVLSAQFFTYSMRNVVGEGGGIYHAIIGTLLITAAATIMSVPIGMFTAIYLVEYGDGGRLSRWITFLVDVMTGIPSIVAGLFVYTFLLLGTDARPFGAAGSLALAILMLPVVVRSSEEMLKLVPRELRESAYALGIPKWRTVLKVVLPTALSGLITSALLAVARVTGETAPLILLTGYAGKINNNPLSGDQDTLPMMVWDQLGKRTGNSGAFTDERAWGAALTLVLLVLVLNVAARLLARLAQPKAR